MQEIPLMDEIPQEVFSQQQSFNSNQNNQFQNEGFFFN
jgi:hypothetical protein